MGISLAEYAAQHPQEEPAQQAAPIRTYREAAQDRETVEQIKAGISQQLAQGNAPQYILYSALRAIGILTQDQAWAEAGIAALDSVYADLAQQSMLAEESSAAADRLAQMQADYCQKTRRQIRQSLTKLEKLQRALSEAERAVNALDGNPPPGFNE
jgi:hypothetical protein